MHILESFWPKLGEGFYEEGDALPFQEDTTANLIEAFSDSSSNDDLVDNIKSSTTLSFFTSTYCPRESSNPTASPSDQYTQGQDLASVSQPTKVSKYANILLRDSTPRDLQVSVVQCQLHGVDVAGAVQSVVKPRCCFV